MSKKGWIKLHRRIRGHWLYQEKRKFSRFEAWVDLLLEANHKENKFLLGNDLVECRRGQIITSIRELGNKWGWSNTKVYSFLDLLKQDGMIDYESDTKKTVVTIANYGTYQDKDDTETTPDFDVFDQNDEITDFSDDEKKTPESLNTQGLSVNPKDTKTTQKRHKNDTKTFRRHTNKNDKECSKNVKNEKKYILSSEQTDDAEENPEVLKFDESSIEIQLARFMRDIMLNIKPDSKVPGNDARSLQSWAKHIDYMIRIDKRTPRDIADLFKWAQEDSFWCANIRSPRKLREKWDTLELQRSRKATPQNKNLSKLAAMYEAAKKEEGRI